MQDELTRQAQQDGDSPQLAADKDQSLDHSTEPVRAFYARLAEAYAAMPTVPDHGGGVSGDRYPL